MVKLLILIFVTITTAQAQYSLGSKNEAMASNSVIATNEWAVHGNSAGITNVSSGIFSVDYRQYFLSKEMRDIAAVGVFPFKKKYYIAAGFYRYGIDVYQESKYAVAYAQKFGKKLSLSINQNYHQLWVQNYFQKNGYSVDAGVQWKLSSKLILGAMWQNIGFLGYWQQQNNVFPSLISAGTLWEIDESVQLAAGFYYPLKSLQNPAVRVGLNYDLLQTLSLQAGIISFPFSYHTGFGTQFRKVQLHMAYQQQQVLGAQTQISLAYAW